MLANTLTLADDNAVEHNFDLVSRIGMDSIRREVGVSSDQGSSLQIKNTVDLNAPTAKNRHLVQLTWNEIDEITGEIRPCSIHAVISRTKGSSDETLASKAYMLGLFLMQPTVLPNIVVGGN